MRRILVTPTPGYVIKTSTTRAGFFTPQPISSSASPQCKPTSIQVPNGLKIFINVAYSSEIPAPPTSVLPAPEEKEIIERAMAGDADSKYFVPVVVNEGREDKDKAGKPSIVFDAILNPSLKSRMTKDINFRSFVLDIIISHVESPPLAPHSRSLILSRTLAMPNIRYKGTPSPREVEIPDFTPSRLAEAVASIVPLETKASKLLIEEISAEVAVGKQKQPKSILKRPADERAKIEKVVEEGTLYVDAHTKTGADAKLETPVWRCESDHSPQRKIVIEIPKLLPLNEQTSVDVEKARAEWRIGEGCLVLYI
ncbi:PIH1 family [Hysterangium stoloniferum]|nr:PIH1 family [Hysterangium stoloniferum]